MNYLLIYLLVINIIAFLMYWRDKRLAQQHKWRIPEKTLLGVAVIGGGIGAYIAMQIFRHKTKHVQFAFGVPIIIAIHAIIAIAWFVA